MNEMDPSPGVGRFLTVADAAEVLAITPAQVLDLVRSGELIAITVGRASLRIERVVLEEYIEARYEEARRRQLWEGATDPTVVDLTGRQNSPGHNRTSST